MGEEKRWENLLHVAAAVLCGAQVVGIDRDDRGRHRFRLVDVPANFADRLYNGDLSLPVRDLAETFRKLKATLHEYRQHGITREISRNGQAHRDNRR